MRSYRIIFIVLKKQEYGLSYRQTIVLTQPESAILLPPQKTGIKLLKNSSRSGKIYDLLKTGRNRLYVI